MRNRLLSIVTALFIGTVGAMTAPAQAQAQAPGVNSVACVEAFPASLSVYVEYRYNSCGGAVKKVRVDIAWGPDSDCYTLHYGEGFRWEWYVGSFRQIKNC
jgi:hypothetical protein